MLGRVGGDFGRMGLVRPAGHLAGASLDLNFVASSGYPAAPSLLLTTTRSSSGDYADNSAGVWSSFAANIPRITDKGLLVEEARTNSIRNNSMQGAVAGTPGTLPTNVTLGALGTLTRSVVAVGSENGIDYWDLRLVGTTSNTSLNINLDGAPIVAAANGQAWTHSDFLAVVGGGFTNITGIAVRMAIYDGGAAYLGEVGSPSVLNSLPSSLGTRQTTTGTIANASTALMTPYLQFTWASGVAIDITLRIGWPQLELGAFATSPIRTTAAAATRAADAITTPFSAAGAYTLFVQGVPLAPTTYTLQQNALQADAVNDTQRLVMRRVATTGGLLAALVGGTGVSLTPAGTWAASARGKWATAVAAGDQASCFNGGTVVTGTAASLPTAPTTLRLGSNSAATESFNGWLERATGFAGTRLTNAQLQAITAP